MRSLWSEYYDEFNSAKMAYRALFPMNYEWLKCLNNYRMNCYEIWHKYSRIPDNNSKWLWWSTDISSSTTLRFAFDMLKKTSQLQYSIRFREAFLTNIILMLRAYLERHTTCGLIYPVIFGANSNYRVGLLIAFGLFTGWHIMFNRTGFFLPVLFSFNDILLIWDVCF